MMSREYDEHLLRTGLSDLPEEPLFREPRAERLEEFLRLKDGKG
jgi:hypothetical protein